MLKTHRITDEQFDNFLALCSDQPGILSPDDDLHSQDWSRLLEHRNALNAARRDLRASCAGRAMDQSERDTLRVIAELIEDVQAEIDYRDSINDKSPRASASRGRKTPPDAGDSPSRPLARVAGDGTVHGGRPALSGPVERIPRVVDLAAPVVPPTYAALFGEPLRAQRREDDSFARFLNAVALRDSQYLLDTRPRAAGATSQIAEAGGFAVPSYVNARLMELVIEQSQFLRYCRVLPMEGQTVSYPVLNIKDRTKGPGDLKPAKVAEGATATRQTPRMDNVLLTAHKKVTYWSATSEMLQDSVPGTDQALMRSAAGAFAMELDREILSGSGVAEGVGALKSACLIVHPKDGSQSANTVSFTNLTGMIARLAPGSFNQAIWVVNPTVLPQLFGVYLATGASGGIPAPMTQLPDGSYRLFGRPVVVSDFAPALSSEADISLLDLGWLVVGLREDLRFEVSRDFLFSSDEVAFKMVRRGDVQSVLTGAITPANGSSTLSPFVALQAR